VTVEHEEWREIPAYPGYDVSDHGRVRAWWGRGGNCGRLMPEPRIVDGCINRWNGYRYVLLYRRTRAVHRLVLEAFVGPCPPGMLTRHLNNIRLDNRLENLAWGTPQQNMLDKAVHGTMARGEAGGNSVLRDEQVMEIRRRRAAGERGTDLAREFGVDPSTVCQLILRHTWKHLP
jgi:hypothetical protein